MNFYCVDCKEKFQNKELYINHVVNKKICPRCLKQFKTVRTLSVHIDPKRKTKCENKALVFFEQMNIRKTMSDMHDQSKKTGKSVDELKSEVQRLNDIINMYKEKGLDALEQVTQQSHRAPADPLNPVDIKTLTLHAIFKPTTSVATHTGYSNEAWKSMVLGNNEDTLLSAEFGAKDIDQLNTDIIQVEHAISSELGPRQEHSNISEGFISSKFNQTLEYSKGDLDEIDHEIIIDGGFDDSLHLNNAAISTRRQTQLGDEILDLDFDIYSQASLQHLSITD